MGFHDGAQICAQSYPNHGTIRQLRLPVTLIGSDWGWRSEAGTKGWATMVQGAASQEPVETPPVWPGWPPGPGADACGLAERVCAAGMFGDWRRRHVPSTFQGRVLVGEEAPPRPAPQQQPVLSPAGSESTSPAWATGRLCLGFPCLTSSVPPSPVRTSGQG